MKLLFVVVFVTFLASCSAALVPETKDPAKKLGWARELIDKQDRPIPAERLIKEALKIYETEKDELGQAMAYRAYAELYKSDAYANSPYYKGQEGYAARYQTAIGYYKKSLDLFVKNGDLFGASNVSLQSGFLYAGQGDLRSACQSFDNSLAYHRQATAANPGTRVSLPKEFATFEEGIAFYKQKASCAN